MSKRELEWHARQINQASLSDALRRSHGARAKRCAERFARAAGRRMRRGR